MLIIKFPYYRTAVGGNFEPVTVEAIGDNPLQNLNGHELTDLANMIEQEKQRRLQLPIGFDEQALDYVRRNDKIGLIKHIRWNNGLSLVDSKALVDREWSSLLTKVAEADRK